ncbi:ABC transporter substrate-binding protein [Acidovorax sp. PRC11]|uniref:ABC transporter substrate-binding protein n=1 Tax=Acidovorax sp. PRC11 TaxID=2962592 RepID=UPI002881C1C4|nr:ABC transporter substrate-binding protein [Acidovorax sp. PRC11]MDT0139493.1 ABC transporter substrate-binding protein [Acidovorax sp. PRC11]
MTSSTSSPARLGRRGFLGASASTAAAAACGTAPALAAAATASGGLPAPAVRRTVGVLLPESSRYPTLSAEFLAGLDAGAAASGLPAPRWLPLPYGRSARAAVRQAQAAVQSGSVDALAGWLPADAAADLVPLLQEHAVPFLASDTGADRPSGRPAARSPWLIPHTLALWESCALLGHEAPRRWGSRAVLCMGFLESGYDFPHEFRAAFEAAGGTVAALHVSGLPDGRPEFDGLVAALKGTSADFVVALYSGRQAGRFRAAWQRLGMERQRPLLDLPVALETTVSTSSPGAAMRLGTDAGGRLARWQAMAHDRPLAASAQMRGPSQESPILQTTTRQRMHSGWTNPYLVT